MSQKTKRFIVTLIVMLGLVGGSGFAIVYEALTTSGVNLAESQLFNIWLGATLGFGGVIITALYNDKDKDEIEQ